MTNLPLISVVVPVYKVEKYVNTCVESLLQQSYPNLEIFLVDDGSPDRCPALCDGYAARDPRVRVIHKENGGLSDARNVGIRQARGAYISFIDSDDFVGQHHIAMLYDALEHQGADVSICDYAYVNEDAVEATEKLPQDEIAMTNVECLKEMYHPVRHGMEFVAWGKLYKTSLFTDNQIFYPVGKLHEDTFTTYQIMYRAQKVAFTDGISYFYRQRAGSIMRSSFGKERLAIGEATCAACSFFKAQKEPELLAMAVNLHLRTLIKLYGLFYRDYPGVDKKQLLQQLRKEYRRDFKAYGQTPGLPGKNKALYFAFYGLPSRLWSRLIP